MPTRRLLYREGGRAWFLFEIRNSGYLPVEVLAPRDDPDFRALFTTDELRIGPRPEESRPFEPFTLDRGEAETLIVFGRFAHCETFDFGGSWIIGWTTVRHRVLGVEAEEEFELPSRIEVASPRNCPGRKSGAGG